MGKSTIGIDIGFDTIKLVALEKQGNGFRLLGMGSASIPPNSWTTDEIKNIPEIAKVIQSTLHSAKPHGIATNQIVPALPESVIFSGAFTVPIMPDQELKKAIPFEAAEKLSINLEEYQIDFETTGSACQLNSVLKDPKKTEKGPKSDKPTTTDKPALLVFAVAAKKTLINSVIELCHVAHLDPVGLDIKPSAAVRAAVVSNDKEARLVVDLGASAIGTFVAEGSALRLISTVPIGFRALQENKLLNEVPKEMPEKLSPIFDEIVHLTRFFENRVCAGTKIREVILIGGGSNLPGIDKLFEQETGFKTTISNPFVRVDTHRFPIPENVSRTYADAIGLAMR